MNHLDQCVELATSFIAEQFTLPLKFGVVLGTGSGVVAAQIDTIAEFDYGTIPHFPVSTALGHKGRLICGTLNDIPMIAMDGRFHLYEGHDVDDATFGIRVMRRLGVEVLFVTNASGGLNPKYQSGDIMIIQSNIDLMFRTSSASSVNPTLERPSQRADRYDVHLAEEARQCARMNDFQIQSGVYAALMGPNYETRAEYRMLRRIGADVAGMSTVPEVNVATKLQMRVLALSVVTNVANPDSLEPTSGEEVIDAAQSAAPRICQILKHAMKSDELVNPNFDAIN